MFLPSPWNDIRVKHAWDAVPTNWECQAAHQPTLRMIYVAFKPHRENTLIEALYECRSPSLSIHAQWQLAAID
ncbi:hypothetical protein EI94DRAFT_1752445 [Lactarius quietus]|nr:hypothetical protein EI94DRAFT_1754100 [Lactarius quietus]KAF8259107.1 hypothetical protein EI94DRAFT_1752445 [Lactarius quietus]